MNPEDRIRKSVEKWFITEPLFLSVWVLHSLEKNSSILNIRVGRGKIEYNPDFIQALSNQQLDMVLQLEAMRIVLKHPYARKKEIATLAYMASNITLQEYLNTPLPIPNAEAVFGNPNFKKQYFEFYYQKLLEKYKSYTSLPNQESSSPKIEQYLDSSFSGIENTIHWDSDEFQEKLINDKIQETIQNNSWGNITNSLKELIIATLAPKLNYKKILSGFRASILSQKRILTRMKPNRRYDFLYMGSKYKFSTKLLFAVDVSGSISNDDLKKGFSIINRFFKYGIESIDVIQFDTELKGKLLSLNKAKKEYKVIGRGGTNFQDVIEFIDTNPSYDGLIIFTDGDAPKPNKPKNKKTKILWLLNSEASYNSMKKKLNHIGKCVYVKDV